MKLTPFNPDLEAIDSELHSEINETVSEVHEHVAEGNIIAFEAPQRRGKTLSGCIWSLEAHQKHKKVFSTIEFKFPYTPLRFNDLKLQNENNPLRNGHLFIDELNMYLDARASMSKVNRDFCSFLLQVKKQGLTVSGTTHQMDYLDKRFRQNYDFKIITDVFPKFPHTPQVLTMNILNGPTTKYCNKKLKLKVAPFLGLYNTFNVFNPFDGMSQTETKTKELKALHRKQQGELNKRLNHVPEPIPDFKL